LTLAQARKKREEENVRRRNGGAEIPRNRSQAITGKLFAVARDEYLAHNATLWGARSQARNRYLLETYAKPLNETPVSRITTQQVANVLKADDENGKPIWTGPDDNRDGKLRGLIEGIINGYADPNPATWEALKVPAYRLELKRAEPKGHPTARRSALKTWPICATRFPMSGASSMTPPTWNITGGPMRAQLLLTLPTFC